MAAGYDDVETSVAEACKCHARPLGECRLPDFGIPEEYR